MKKLEPQESLNSFVQLSIPLNRKPFLHIKNKLRRKNARVAIDEIVKNAHLLKFELETGAIQSPEACLEIRQFLDMLGLK